jgi:cyanate lyase
VLASADWQRREGYLCDLIVERTGAGTLKAIAQELDARGVRTPAGRDRWAPAQVSRLLAD